MLPRESEELDNQFEDELEEYEFDILWDEHKGLWVAKLINGNFLISVRA